MAKQNKQDGSAPNKPEQQTGEEFGDIKRGQLNDRNNPERSDTARGSEPATRSHASRHTGDR